MFVRFRAFVPALRALRRTPGESFQPAGAVLVLYVDPEPRVLSRLAISPKVLTPGIVVPFSDAPLVIKLSLAGGIGIGPGSEIKSLETPFGRTQPSSTPIVLESRNIRNGLIGGLCNAQKGAILQALRVAVNRVANTSELIILRPLPGFTQQLPGFLPGYLGNNPKKLKGTQREAYIYNTK